MRKRMQELAAGRFEYEGPKVIFENDRMELMVKEQENYIGSFQIQCVNKIPMRGIVFSNNPRMEVKNPQFDGLSATINFEFHTEGLLEGDIQKGEFYVILNKNEYSLSFVASVVRQYAKSSLGEIKSLHDFGKLAKESFDEAYELFCREDFFNILRNESDRVIMYARILAYPMAPAWNLEEFLVKTGMKNESVIQLKNSDFIFYDVKEDLRDTIELQRSCWGVTEIKVTTEASFIRFPKDSFKNNDFVGNSLSIPFFVSAHNLHAGWNYTTIAIDCGFKKYEVIFSFMVSE